MTNTECKTLFMGSFKSYVQWTRYPPENYHPTAWMRQFTDATLQAFWVCDTVGEVLYYSFSITTVLFIFLSCGFFSVTLHKKCSRQLSLIMKKIERIIMSTCLISMHSNAFTPISERKTSAWYCAWWVRWVRWVIRLMVLLYFLLVERQNEDKLNMTTLELLGHLLLVQTSVMMQKQNYPAAMMIDGLQLCTQRAIKLKCPAKACVSSLNNTAQTENTGFKTA